jgi:hypothetical protein
MSEGFTESMGEPDLDAREADEVIDTDVVFGEDEADDELDRSYSPPERPLGLDRFGTTLAEERAGETLDQRLAEEEPDPALQVEPLDPRDREAGLGEPGDDALERPVAQGWGRTAAPRSGRLVAPDEGFGEDREKDLIAQDVGIDGGAAGAEEAAMHVVDADDLPDGEDLPDENLPDGEGSVRG